MTNRDLKEAKKAAVANRLKELHGNIDVLAGMWDERTLDMLILILGVGHVELD